MDVLLQRHKQEFVSSRISCSFHGKNSFKSSEKASGSTNGVPQFYQKREKPSKRPSKQELQDEDIELKTTPEFRAFVAKKLIEILDRTIEDDLVVKKAFPDVLSNNEGIKLLSSSTDPLRSPDQDTFQTRSIQIKKNVHLSSSDDSSEDERLAEAVVSPNCLNLHTKLPIGKDSEENVSGGIETVKKTGVKRTDTEKSSESVHSKKKKCRLEKVPGESQSEIKMTENRESEKLKEETSITRNFETNDLPCVGETGQEKQRHRKKKKKCK